MPFFLRVIWRRVCAPFHYVFVENVTSPCVHCWTRKAHESWQTDTYCPDCHAHIKLMKPRSLT